MKGLFIFPNAPLSPNFSGAASRYLNSFMALYRLGADMHVWRFLSKDVERQVYRYEAKTAALCGDLRSKVVGWQDVVYSPSPVFRSRIELVRKALFLPIELTFSETTTLRDKLLQAVKAVKPDFIWAEWGSGGALVATSCLALPWVYAHHDMYHRIVQVRQKVSVHKLYLSERIRLWAMKRGERQIICKATAIVTGSQTEARKLKVMGGKYISLIPTTYEPVNLDYSNATGSAPARILHLGSLRTTSNYLGLMAYLDKIQPQLDGLCNEQANGMFRLHIIGDLSGAKVELMERIKSSDARLYGHVDDLSSILRPFDIVIIPYEHDTGTRTKLSLLFNHAQVVIATQAAVAGSPELRSGENCVVLPDLQAFAKTLSELVRNRETREWIGRCARKTFEADFTLEAQLPKFGQVLQHLT
jgi:glycosyltransferase involved in cell wall biosynthesis